MRWHCAFDRIDAQTAVRIARGVGTPYILVDEASLEARRHAVREATAGTRLFLPYKSSPISYFRRYFAASGLGGEVASGVELAAALTHGIAPDSLILNQPARDVATFRRAIALGVTIVADGVADVRTLAESATVEHPARLLLRVNLYRVGGTGWSRFGMPVDGAEFAEAVALAAHYESLDIIGLHSHLGTNIPSADAYFQATERLALRWRALESALGRPLEVLDLGGGFATPSSCPLYKSPGSWRPDPPAAILTRIREALAPADLHNRVALWLEPGRVLVEDSGVLVTRVVDLRSGPIGRQVTCDSGVNQVPTAGYLRHPIARIGDQQPAPADLCPSLLCGSLCMEADVIAADCALPGDLAIGDLLKIGAVGCYDLAFAFPFIDGRCPILLRRLDGGLECLRRRELGGDFHTLEGEGCTLTC